MNTFVIYIIATTVSLGIFYLAYAMLLRKEPLFRFNRVYLLSSLVLAYIIPLILFVPEFFSLSFLKSSASGILYAFALAPVEITSNASTYPSVFSLLGYIYLAGLLFFAGRLISRIAGIYKLSNHSVRTQSDETTILWSNSDIPPFSFFRSMFLPVNLKGNPHLNEIIHHEQIHINSFHSIDIIITQLIQTVFWVNPFIPLIEKSLREIHEFEADKAVIRAGTDPVTYTRILFNQDKVAQAIVLGNNFNYSLIKRRLTMFYKKSTRFAKLKAIVIMPAAICTVMIYTMGCQQSTNNSATALKPADSNIMPPPPPPPPPPAGTNDESGVYTVVENMPQFPGGDEGRVNYMIKNLKYPKEAIEKKLEGTVYVSFIVEPDGTVSTAKVLKGIGKICDEEALRVISAMPKWKPGTQNGKTVRVQFTLPVSFKLK